MKLLAKLTIGTCLTLLLTASTFFVNYAYAGWNDCVVSGAGTSAANGTYVNYTTSYAGTGGTGGTNAGHGEAWRLDIGGHFYYLALNSEWDIVYDQPENNIAVTYYQSNVASPTTATASWSTGGAGSNPAPTVTGCDFTVGNGGGATNSTTTADNTTGNSILFVIAGISGLAILRLIFV